MLKLVVVGWFLAVPAMAEAQGPWVGQRFTPRSNFTAKVGDFAEAQKHALKAVELATSGLQKERLRNQAKSKQDLKAAFDRRS